MISFLVAAGVDLDLICLQAFIPDDFKLMARRLPSFHGFISAETGSAILARKTAFDSLQFEDQSGVVELRAVPAGLETVVRIWSTGGPISIDGVESGPRIIAGTIDHLEGFTDALRKVGNFEPTRPFDHGPSITDHIFVKGVKPISGDVDDGRLRTLRSEARRIEAVLAKYGSDHLPIRATIRI